MTSAEARTQHLEPYKFRPGQSGNPAGFPKGRREQLEMIEQLAREASPEMIAILQELARHSEDDRVRTMAASKVLEYLPKRKEYDPGEAERSPWHGMSADQLREKLIGLVKDISKIEVPPDFEPSPEDLERHEVVRAATAMAVYGVRAIDGRRSMLMRFGLRLRPSGTALGAKGGGLRRDRSETQERRSG
jgi:hypothetical protein